MEWQTLAFQLVNGLTMGGVYAVIALGYTLVYGILFMINFAHGEIFMVGSFAGFLLLTIFMEWGIVESFLIPCLVITFIGAMMASSILGVAVERIAYRPLRRAPRLAPLISAIGTSIFLQNVVMLIVKARMKIYPDVFPQGSLDIGNISISYIRIFIILTSIVMMYGLYLFIKGTKTGKAMRAVAEDKDTAALMGIDVNRIIARTFFIGSALAGAAGVMVGLYYTQIDHMMGFVPGIKAFTAAVLGGIGNVPGAMLGGYFLGFAEVIGIQFLPAEYKDLIAFSLLVLVLVFRPRGILGEVVSERA